MREIKFRAWDKKDKIMREVVKIDWEGGDEIFIILCNGKTYKSDEVELMQYTGLKDKNGKEIYEGDIIQWEKKIITMVKYIGNKFSLGDWYENDYPNPEEKCKIIGNIYENPELGAKGFD